MGRHEKVRGKRSRHVVLLTVGLRDMQGSDEVQKSRKTVHRRTASTRKGRCEEEKRPEAESASGGYLGRFMLLAHRLKLGSMYCTDAVVASTSIVGLMLQTFSIQVSIQHHVENHDDL